MQEAGLEDMEKYVLKRQNTASRYIAKQPILYIFKETVRMPGTWLDKRWWEKEGLELVGLKAVAASEERGG